MNKRDAVVFVIDDDISVRASVENLFRSVGLTVLTFESANEFLSSQRPDVPACLVLDVRLPGGSGLELQQQLAGNQNGMPVIFITGHADIRMSVQAMKAGAVEFLTKPYRDQDLLDAVQQAIERDRAARAARAGLDQLYSRYESLSAREKEVMGLVVRGLLNKQIAAQLGTTEATVKLHRGKVMHKMQAHSLADLIRMAERLSPTTDRSESN